MIVKRSFISINNKVCSEDSMARVVILGMSGGVDSSMALKMLKNDFDRVIGVNHVVYKGVKSSSREVLERAEKTLQR